MRSFSSKTNIQLNVTVGPRHFMIHKVFNGGWHIRLYIENDLLRALDTSMSGNFECVRTSNLAGISWWSNEYNLWCWRHNQHLLRMRSKRSNSMVHARQVVTVTVITMIIIFMMLILSNSVREFTNKTIPSLRIIVSEYIL